MKEKRLLFHRFHGKYFFVYLNFELIKDQIATRDIISARAKNKLLKAQKNNEQRKANMSSPKVQKENYDTMKIVGSWDLELTST